MKRKLTPAWQKVLGLAFTLLGLFGKAHAVIPNNVTSNLTVSASDFCNGQCTIYPNVTLTITGANNFNFNGPVHVATGGRLVINNGAVATFTHTISVASRASMEVNNSMVRMHPGTNIILRGSSEGGNFTTHIGAKLIGNYATFTGMLITNFWEGIVTMRGVTSNPVNFYDRFKESLVMMDHCTIERARNAITNYNYIGFPNYPEQTSGGNMDIRFSTFRNNIRSLRLYNDHHAFGEVGGAGYDPNSADGLNWSLLFQYVDFVIDANFSPQTINSPIETPTEMVYATNCNSISFLSCRFLSSNNPYGKSMAGIFGTNTGLKVQRYFYNTSVQRGEFKGLGTGIALYNALQVNRVPVILNCDFDCQNDINLFSCFNSYIVNNKFLKTFASGQYPSTSIHLYRSTGYKVEGNTINSNTSLVSAFAAGIVINGSGVSNNEIYRNTFTAPTAQNNGLAIGIQSIGRNRNNLSNGTSGLKILCNDIRTNYYKGRDVTVLRDYSNSSLLYYHGIHRTQYAQGLPNRSAGNTFISVPNTINMYKNYYMEPGTNVMTGFNPFRYGYNSGVIAENPANSNLGLINKIATLSAKNCGVKVLANMPPPRYDFDVFKAKLKAIEDQIAALEEKKDSWTEDDLESMEVFLADQSSLIDSIVTYYQFHNYTDSIAMVYALTTKGYQYKLYLASALKDLSRFEDAINVLNEIPSQYDLDDMSAQEVSRLAVLYATAQWLAENENDWINMPPYYKDPVYAFEFDPTSAGGVAMSLLATYEGNRYEPYYVEFEGEGETISTQVALAGGGKMYPSPASDVLNVRWDEPASLILTDISGRTVQVQDIAAGLNKVNIVSLKPGMYFGLIKAGAKTLYQQKVIKL